MYGNAKYDRFRSTIQYTHYEGGDKVTVKEKWVPDFYIPVSKNGVASGYKNGIGQDLERIVCDTWAKRKSKLEFYKECGIKTYGSDLSPENKFFLEHYPQQLSLNIPDVRTVFIDIETETEAGFPFPHIADQRVNLITIFNLHTDDYYTLALPFNEEDFGKFEQKYKYPDLKLHYKEFRNENDLLKEFIKVMNILDPDIMSGWNSSGFDIPYLYNRILSELGESYLKKLAPFGTHFKREKQERNNFGQVETTYTYALEGVTDMDYKDIYKQFEWNEKDSYKLDDVCEDELGEKKKEHPDDCSFRDFYRKYWCEFVDYNIQDVRLLKLLDRKKGYIRQAITLSYTCKCTFKDNVGTITKQETAIYDHLFNTRNEIMDDDWDRSERVKEIIPSFDGAYVKDPISGLYKWVIDVDIKSLYPSIIIMENISPDSKIMQIEGKTILWDRDDSETIDIILADGTEHQTTAGKLKKKIRDNKWHLSMNNTVFEYKGKKLGVIPSILTNWFDERQKTKKESHNYAMKAIEVLDRGIEVPKDFGL